MIRRAIFGAALLASASAYALPSGGPPSPAFCTTTFIVEICGDETFNASNTHETFSVTSVGSGAQSFPVVNGAFFTIPPGDNADVNATLQISGGGGGAAAGVIDVLRLLQNRPDLAGQLLAAKNACQGAPSSAACTAAIKAVAGQLKESDLEAAALFGRACQHASDTTTRSSTNLNNRVLAPIAAAGDDGSTASISVDVLHRGSRQVTQPICHNAKTGSLPPPGNYENRDLGNVLIELAPQHGGTVGPNLTVNVIAGDNALGTFNLSTTTPGQTATITYSGQIISIAQCKAGGGSNPIP